MANTENLPIRDARDRLIDQLGIGQTFPLRDLPVKDDKLTVTYNTKALIPIDSSQGGVVYQLHDDDQPVQVTADGDEGVGSLIEADGTGETIELETYKILDDVTFEIFTRKQPWYVIGMSDQPEVVDQLRNGQIASLLREQFLAERGISFSEDVAVSSGGRNKWVIEDTSFRQTFQVSKSGDALSIFRLPEKETYLHETATVKVGLDTSLLAWINTTPHLIAGGAETDTAPRIIAYGASVQVTVQNSQEGVDYKLVTIEEPSEAELSTTDVRGDLSNIVLTTKAVLEDVDIRVRATKIFDPSENREDQTDLLDVVVPLKVRANSDLPVVVDPVPIIGYGQNAVIKVGNTQQSARYHLYVRLIPDTDIIHRLEAGVETIDVPVDGEPAAHIRKPAWAGVWTTPEDYAPVGEALPGSGGDIEFVVPGLTEDSIFLVCAEKVHNIPAVSQPPVTEMSAMQVEEAAVALVAPDPARQLSILTHMDNGATNGQLQVSSGQPGIFYHFRYQPDGEDLGLPAYFHKHSWNDETHNKGIGQFKIEVDVAIPRAYASEDGDFSETPPAMPLLDTGAIDTGKDVHIHAVKAQTRVAVPMDNTLSIPAGPDIAAKDPVINIGGETQIRIVDSSAAEWYQLLIDGVPLADAVKGTGQDRLLDTGTINDDTAVQLFIQRPDAPIAVERYLETHVWVRPDASLRVSADDSIVDYGATTKIHVYTTEVGVRYRLKVNGKTTGSWQDGTGGTISFTTPAILEDTVLGIRTFKQTSKKIYSNLTAQISVAARPNPSLEVTAVNSVIDYSTAASIQVAASQASVGYQLMLGGSAVGDAVSGTGDTIALTSGALISDSRYSIRAQKDSAPEITLTLTQQAMIAVRPDATLGVSAAAETVEYAAATDIQVEASQSGVSYQLVVGGALVGALLAGDGKAITFSTGSLTADTTFTVRATKASTQVDLTQQITVAVQPNPALPVSAALASVAYNGLTDIQVGASEAGVAYQLMAGGAAVGGAVSGDGDTIALSTGALVADTTFTVRATRSSAPDSPVDLAQLVAVTVSPNPNLEVSTPVSTVAAGETAAILVTASQNGVRYDLLAAELPVGESVSGSGDTITLATGPITEDTVFTVRATRDDNPALTADLVQQATITVEAEPEPPPE